MTLPMTASVALPEEDGGASRADSGIHGMNESPSASTPSKRTPSTGPMSDQQSPSPFLDRVAQHEQIVQRAVIAKQHPGASAEILTITGDDLQIADVVAVAYHEAKVQISGDESVRQRVDASVAFLRDHLDQGNVVYGVNTGFGGSADTRSSDLENTQRGLVQLLTSGVILPHEADPSSNLSQLGKHEMSRPAVRASMLVRANCLLRGHSGVRLSVIQTLIDLLNRDFLPVIPLRGSISASGDLSPLSYIAGALEGSSDIYVDCRMGHEKREIMTADKALLHAGLTPIVLGPKEGLGLLNGTAVSCAVGCLALHETQSLALGAQVLTGMCTEAMGGCADNYHPFIARVRPHPGQAESAGNISRQIEGSLLVADKSDDAGELYQDRYGLRTATQWVGPYLEDLALALNQLSIELNSTTDNPLVDPETKTVHHGGNFQAVAVTSAVEKARLALQMFGKLMFAQCTELINPMLNNILTPNLCFDDPSTSFTFKGVDINMAAYMAELAYLANPVSSHVQSAEMQNQAVNSLALVSARFTMDAAEVVSLMTAAYLYAVCQALDLHALFRGYSRTIELCVRLVFEEKFAKSFPSESVAHSCWGTVLVALRGALRSSKNRNRLDRGVIVAEATIIPLTKSLMSSSSTTALSELRGWMEDVTRIVQDEIRNARVHFSTCGPTTLQYLSSGSAVVYRFVREELQVPLHRGLVEDPAYPHCELDGVTITPEDKKTVGSRIGVIYAALRTGRFGPVFVASLS